MTAKNGALPRFLFLVPDIIEVRFHSLLEFIYRKRLVKQEALSEDTVVGLKDLYLICCLNALRNAFQTNTRSSNLLMLVF